MFRVVVRDTLCKTYTLNNIQLITAARYCITKTCMSQYSYNTLTRQLSFKAVNTFFVLYLTTSYVTTQLTLRPYSCTLLATVVNNPNTWVSIHIHVKQFITQWIRPLPRVYQSVSTYTQGTTERSNTYSTHRFNQDYIIKTEAITTNQKVFLYNFYTYQVLFLITTPFTVEWAIFLMQCPNMLLTPQLSHWW